MIIDCVVNEPVVLHLENIGLRDDAKPSVWWKADAGLTTHDLLSDRLRATPTAVGTYALQASSNDEAPIATINAVAAPVADTKKVLLVGDSITFQPVFGYAIYLQAALGARIAMLGTQGSAPANQEGHSGQSALWMYSDAASPMTDSGGDLDIAAYLTAIGDTPEIIFWMFGTNPAIAATLATFDADIAPEFTALDALIAAWKIAAPGVEQFVGTIWPGNGTVANTLTLRSQMHRYCELAIERYSGRESEAIRMCHTYPQISRRFDYSGVDSVHPSLFGHAAIARVVRHSISARF